MTGFGIFAVTPDGTGLVQSLDSQLSASLHVVGWGPTELTRALGSPIVIMLASPVVCLVLWKFGPFGKRQLRPIAVTAVAGLVAWLPAVVVRRPSPGHLGDLSAANTTSFPSIAAAMIATLVLTTIAAAGIRARLGMRVTIVGVGIGAISARLLTASAWPMDELAGVLVGLLIYRLLDGSIIRHQPSSPLARRSRHLGAVTVAAMLAIGVPVGWSYVTILRASGDATVDQRTVEWLRDNGLTPLVDRGESWWLWRNLPSPTATIAELPAPPITTNITASADSQLPPALAATIQPSLPGEGIWTAATADSAGRPQIATTTLRPDPSHPSIVAGVAWINAATTKLTLIAGTRQPGGGAGPDGGHVPAASLGSLLAVFNSGYKMKDTPGGALIEGRTTRTMVDGLATLAVRKDGTATVGEWGTDLSASQGYIGLRQNLHLMVRNGVIIEGVTTNAGGKWGTVRNTLPTWRSGVGVTATGDLLYVGGNHLTLAVLANALVHAGAVTAMELDIHRGMVTFNLFTHQPKLTGHKLLPDMTRPADRYLSADWRDFVMVTSR
ncbi:MAG: phosphodiester glycosidase family protein [Ilumatobacteraceae bacterium]